MTDTVKKRLSLKEAGELLGISYRHTLRLKKILISQGIEGLIRKRPDNPPNVKITQQLKAKIINLRKILYQNFNILHFKEKLLEFHDISLSYETLRKTLIDAGLHEPRKKRRVYRRRKMMPKELVLMDSSQLRWIHSIEEPWWLVATIDDAEGKVYAEFHEKDTTEANILSLKEHILRWGLLGKNRKTL